MLIQAADLRDDCDRAAPAAHRGRPRLRRMPYHRRGHLPAAGIFEWVQVSSRTASRLERPSLLLPGTFLLPLHLASCVLQMEVHERDVYTDFLLLLLREAMLEGRMKHLKVVLMSATLKVTRNAF